MRNLPKTLLFTISLLALFVVGCDTDDNVKPTTGDLYDKPLSVIKASIQGKWQLHYGKGGLIANNIHDWGNDDYWEFDFSSNMDRIKAYDEPIMADTTIMWVMQQNNYSGKTYILKFYDVYGYPWNFVVREIRNDTLIIHDHGSDPIFYYFTKH